MTTTMPSRAAIEAADSLAFPDRKPARQELTITIAVCVNGFNAEICFSGQLDQLETLTRRLRDLGMSPAGVHQVSPAATPSALRKSATVTYADDGSPLCGNANCSRHGQPLEPSQHNGYFCKGKDSKTGNPKGYCRTTAE